MRSLLPSRTGPCKRESVEGRCVHYPRSGSALRGQGFREKGFSRTEPGRPHRRSGRELRAYRSLAGIEGLPAQYKRLSPFAIAIEYLEGRDLGGIDRGEIGPGVIRQFEAVVEELHERGWVHLDLQRRSNILLVNGQVLRRRSGLGVPPGGVPLIGRASPGFWVSPTGCR